MSEASGNIYLKEKSEHRFNAYKSATDQEYDTNLQMGIEKELRKEAERE